MLRYALLALAPLIVCLVQISFISALPPFLTTIHIMLVYAVLTLMTSSATRALWYGLIFGSMLDIYTPAPFGVHIIAFVVALIIGHLSLQHVITNKSLYAYLLLVTLATTCFTLTRMLLLWIAYHITGESLYSRSWDVDTLLFFGFGLAGNLMITTLAFYLGHAFSSALQPFFIRKTT